jgi:hypothetical protein
MRVNRDVPVFRQLKRGAGVIEMAMRQDDRFRRSARAKAGFGGFKNLVRSAWKSRVDEGPWPTRAADKNRRSQS